jgi:hypothetical protein
MRRLLGQLVLSFAWLAAGSFAAHAFAKGEPSGGSAWFALHHPAGANDQPQIHTFHGTVTKNGDQFVLAEAKTQKWYQLDDQNAASKFEGKNVTVTGTLDVVKNIIRIQSIAEAAA